MAEPKPFASLTSGLLARKGGARPAMRPQTIDKIGSGGWEDLGWNDMGDIPVEPDPSGHRAPSNITGLTPAPSGRQPGDGQSIEPRPIPAVVEQQRAIEETYALPPVAEEPSEEDFTTDNPVEEDTFEIEASEIEAFEIEVPAVEVPPVAAYEPESAWEEAEPVRQQAEVVELSQHRPDHADARSKAAFTLRLDEERHLKLRLACAVQNRSAQRIVCGALDAYLDSLPELDSLAQQVPARREKRL